MYISWVMCWYVNVETWFAMVELGNKNTQTWQYYVLICECINVFSQGYRLYKKIMSDNLLFWEFTNLLNSYHSIRLSSALWRQYWLPILIGKFNERKNERKILKLDNITNWVYLLHNTNDKTFLIFSRKIKSNNLKLDLKFINYIKK